MSDVPGRLILAATPIGNPADATIRLRDLLAAADVIAAEDTRRLRRLAAELGVAVAAEVVSFYEDVERQRTPVLIRHLRAGSDVVLVTDAGMPAVSDPGYRLVAACAAAGITVTVAPGPSAVLAGLAVSGLASDRFCFEGFAPRKAGSQRRWLAALSTQPRTVVFFESPRRLAATLAAAVEVIGPQRPAVVCRELTKTHEEVRRGTLGELADWAGGAAVLGEIVVVLAGAPPVVDAGDPAVWAGAVAEEVRTGTDRRHAMRAVADRFGVSRRTVYQAVLDHPRG